MPSGKGPAARDNVIDISQRRRKMEPMDGNSVRQVSREECLAALGEVAPLPKDLRSLLAIPEKLYSLERGSASFSSSPDSGISRVTGSLLLGHELPPDIPDYGVQISSRGSNVFCTFVDKSRKVIVYEDVRNMFAKSGSWDFFESNLKEALARARTLESQGEKFSFVISKDSILKAV